MRWASVPTSEAPKSMHRNKCKSHYLKQRSSESADDVHFGDLGDWSWKHGSSGWHVRSRNFDSWIWNRRYFSCSKQSEPRSRGEKNILYPEQSPARLRESVWATDGDGGRSPTPLTDSVWETTLKGRLRRPGA